MSIHRWLFLPVMLVWRALHGKQLLPDPVPDAGRGGGGAARPGEGGLPAGQPPLQLRRGRWGRCIQLRAEPSPPNAQPKRPQQTLPPQAWQHHLCGGLRPLSSDVPTLCSLCRRNIVFPQQHMCVTTFSVNSFLTDIRMMTKRLMQTYLF